MIKLINLINFFNLDKFLKEMKNEEKVFKKNFDGFDSFCPCPIRMWEKG